MASLLELTSQGDVATMSDESKISKVKLQSPQQLYELWERHPWSAYAIDLDKDIEDWATVSEEDKAEAVYGLSSFFVGEERVTTQFSGLVMSYDTQSEEAFLVTQQVDEARHAQFFSRFYDTVLERGGGMEAQLELVRGDLNDSFIELFDHHLVDACRRLATDPSDVEGKVDFVTTYHMIIEGMLALTGQYYLTDFFEQRGIMPGFVEGFQRISSDEHRHVAYGTWFLKESCKDPKLAERVQNKLMELLPIAAGVLVPKGKDPDGDAGFAGYSLAEVNQFAFTALTRRLKVIGVGLPAGAPA